MGLFTQVLAGAIAGTFAVGTAVVKGGIEAVKEGSKIYDEYQKNPKIDIADKVINAAGKSIVAGAKGAGECLEWGYESIKKDIKETKEAEKARLKVEQPRQETEVIPSNTCNTNTTAIIAPFKESDITHTFYTKVVGVTFYDQMAIRQLQKGQILRAVREPINIFHDKNTIGVYSGDTQIGHLSRDLAAEYADKIDNGARLAFTVEEVTGGGSKNYGVNIKGYYCAPSETSFDEYDQIATVVRDDRDCAKLVDEGDKYYNGIGVPEDNDKAFELYMQAANMGYAPALGRVGEMYQYGHGVSQNYEIATQWYYEGATAGDGRSAFRLGWLYHNGKVNGRSDVESARKYYSIAAATDYRDRLGIIERFKCSGVLEPYIGI